MIQTINLEEPANSYGLLLKEVEHYKSKGWDLYGILTINLPGEQKLYRATLNRFKS